MRYPLSVLTMACVAAAAAAAGPNGQIPAGPGQQQIIIPDATATQPAAPTSFRERLRNFFLPRHAEEGAEQTGPSTVQVQKVPLTGLAGTASQLGPVTPQRQDIQMSRKDLDRIGHEQDYSWITGRLVRAASSGRWEIRYAAPGEVDKFGGSLALAPTADLATFHDGDLVCLHGKVVAHGASFRSPAGSIYEAAKIDLIESAGR